MTDTPRPEPVNVFYGKPEESEPAKQPEPTETEGVTTEGAETSEEVKSLQPDESETEVVETVEGEAEELEASADDATDDEETDLYLDLEGTEVSISEVKKWQKGHMMQEDYTRKTMALSDERKAFEKESTEQREQLGQAQQRVQELSAQLEMLVAEDDAVNWDELKEYEPEKFIELKEKADKRKAKLEEIQAERAQPQADPAFVVQEQKRLFEANPDWLDKEGKPTEKMLADQKLFTDYAQKAGFSGEELQSMFQVHHMQTVLKAAKYDQLMANKQKIVRDKAKAPVVRKAKAKTKTEPKKSMVDVFYGS